VRRERMLLATRLDSYPSSATAAITLALVSGATPYRPLTAFDTVATETPAAAATSWMVVRWLMRPEHTHVEKDFENI